MNQVTKSMALVWACIFLSACSVLAPVQVPPMSTYTLGDVSTITQPSHPKTHTILMASNMVANAGYDSQKMTYLNVPYKLKAYSVNQWVSPPAQMLLPLMVRSISQAGYFYAVVMPPYSGLSDYQLDSTLVNLQQEFIKPTSEVRLTVAVTLISAQLNQVIASKQFQVVVPAPGNNPYSGVLAANHAAQMLAQDVAQFTVDQVKRQSRTH